MPGSAVSFRGRTTARTSTSRWAPSGGSGAKWASPSYRLASIFGIYSVSPSSTFKVQRLKAKGYRVFRTNSLFWGSLFDPEESSMRVVTVIAVLLVGGAATLEAQHHFQFEIGGIGTFTCFDRDFGIDIQIGGRGRLGFWITDWLGIEGDGLYQRPHPKGGGAGTDFPCLVRLGEPGAELR